jgi:hypothetical protein
MRDSLLYVVEPACVYLSVVSVSPPFPCRAAWHCQTITRWGQAPQRQSHRLQRHHIVLDGRLAVCCVGWTVPYSAVPGSTDSVPLDTQRPPRRGPWHPQHLLLRRICAVEGGST